MKNVTRLYSKEQIHDYVMSIWKTDLFRHAHEHGLSEAKDYRDGGTHNFVSSIVDKFANLPRFAFDMTDDRIERAHFSTWWGGISHRTYDNPYIHDLYWIHEMAHAGMMVYMRDMTFENFLRKMTDNELHASVVSEVQIYFEMPELRQLSFPQEIYADRFLRDAGLRTRYAVEPELTFEEFKVRRRDTMMDPNPKNVPDFWINRFYTQNAAWGACWAHSFKKVETAMSILRENTVTYDASVNKNQVRRRCLDTLIDAFLADNTTDGIPFKREAEAFAGIYWANRGHYDDAMNTMTTQ
jgi:hypothetical protein